jgi:hypothetical protein
MHPILAPNFSGMFEELICRILHVLFVFTALFYLIRLFASPSPSKPGLPRWFIYLGVLCVISAVWAFVSLERNAGIALSQLNYLPVVPVGLLLCLGATHLLPSIHRKSGKADRSS